MTQEFKIDRDALLRSFAAETEEGLARMEELLVALEANPQDVATRDELFRIVHTLKGNASMLTIPPLVEIAHVTEDLLEKVRMGATFATRPVIDALLAALDSFRAIIAAPASSPAVDVAAIVERIKSAAETTASAASTAGTGQDQSYASLRDDNVLRVELEKLDHIMNLATEGTITLARLRNLLESAEVDETVLDTQRETETLLLELQEQVMKLRMVAVGPVFRRFARLVRDLATQQEKQVRLEIQGEEVELDTTVIRLIRDPLTHMIRNSIDHGIETPAVRESVGKDPCGRLTLAAYQDGGEIVVEVRDDGAGLNRDKILKRAMELGMVEQEGALTDSQVFELIFQPGFSTAAAVSELSGRGVGMDVVRRNIEALKGSVSVQSQPGQGTTIVLRLPLTLAILEGFSVRAGGELLVIPLDYVVECTEFTREAQSGGNLLDLRGSVLPCLRLRDIFGLDGALPDRESVVVVRCGKQVAGIAVDDLLGTGQAIVKPLSKLFKGVTGLSGSTILGNGQIGLIVDVPGLLRQVAPSTSQEVQ